MGWTQVVLLAFAPALFWMWFFYRRDRWEPEPKRLVLKLFLLGALSAAPVYWIQTHLPGGHVLLFDLFVRVAFVEEFFKILPVLLFACWHRQFNEPMDGIIYAIAAALGFATVENVLYGVLFDSPRLILYRAFSSTLAHVGFSGILGYHVGRAKFMPRLGKRRTALALLGVTVVHGVYDWMLVRTGPDGGPALIARSAILVVVPALLCTLSWKMKRADRASPFRCKRPGHERDGECDEQHEERDGAEADAEFVREPDVVVGQTERTV